jgi:hypothetical protein
MNIAFGINMPQIIFASIMLLLVAIGVFAIKTPIANGVHYPRKGIDTKTIQDIHNE